MSCTCASFSISSGVPVFSTRPLCITVTRLADGSTVVSESVIEFWIRAGFAGLSLAWLFWFVWKVAKQKPPHPVYTEADRKRDEAFRQAR